MPNNIRIQEIQSSKIWQKFVSEQAFTVFVQSPEYGKFYEALGEQSFIIGILKDEKVVGGSLVVTTHARRGNFLYLPYGPFLPEEDKKHALSLFTDYLKKYAKQHGYSFIRMSPFFEETEENKRLFQGAGYKSAPMHVLAETTWLLDIRPTEETLLRQMNKNHRNLIRRCEREGVSIKMTTVEANLENLNTLLNITAKRHRFVRFSNKYITAEYKNFLPDHVALFEATLPDGALDASAIIMFYGKMACYRHSASLGKNSKLPSSYLLQWEVIKEAKKRGMEWYNFWGIAPEEATKNHPFFGITHFKKGFGGEVRNLLHCQDMAVSFKYYLNWIIESIRKTKRGF